MSPEVLITGFHVGVEAAVRERVNPSPVLQHKQSSNQRKKVKETVKYVYSSDNSVRQTPNGQREFVITDTKTGKPIWITEDELMKSSR